jgi:hypothetical protein
MESAVTSSTQNASRPARSIDELWLDVLQQIGARTAHELRGALNGAAAIGPFASSAADQLEAVVDMTEALLMLTRAASQSPDVLETVRAFASLLTPSARAEGGSLRVESPAREIGGRAVHTDGTAVRAVIGAALLNALASKGDIRCRVDGNEEMIVSIECVDAEGPLRLAPDVLSVAAAAGVRVQQERQSLSLAFPRAAAGAARQRTPERA